MTVEPPMPPAARPSLDRIELRPIGRVRTAYTRGSGWLDQVRGGWYQQADAAANPLVRPGREGLRAAGLDPPPADATAPD
jgi:hypothetical protein